MISPGDEYSFARWAVLDAKSALDADILDDKEKEQVLKSLSEMVGEAAL